MPPLVDFPCKCRLFQNCSTRPYSSFPCVATPPPSGLLPLAGHNLTVRTLPEPAGTDLRRKLALLTWLPRYLPVLWQAIRQAEAVHAPVPGDIGLIGILLALAQRKPLFVRHCGTWDEPVTAADRFLLWLLERIAGGRNVVLATGGSDRPPSAKNPHIEWIFSSSLTEAELLSLPTARAWEPPATLHLVTVGRLSQGKNIQAIIQSLPAIQFLLPGGDPGYPGGGRVPACSGKNGPGFGAARTGHFPRECFP